MGKLRNFFFGKNYFHLKVNFLKWLSSINECRERVENALAEDRFSGGGKVIEGRYRVVEGTEGPEHINIP